MRSADIREQFLEFFRSKEHHKVKSSSLIPHDDPTLLFTNAGMVQFKSVFTGEESRQYGRAVSSQKCMRAGGKHNDIENVGHTARHHTFFEMLGNFSFGDYFKKEAIIFAWELLTDVYKLPKDRLWVSVYEKDDEALELWQDNSDVPNERIIRLGEKDNFWQMGDTGPCGPCSEILIDQGEEVSCGEDSCAPGCDCDRYLEIWNLVFMQYNRDSSGKMTTLPKPSIDTGMGLERISAVLQGKLNNYDTDLFSDIIGSITANTGTTYNRDEMTDISIRVIADHIRASTFLLSEGLIPSNEGRGYVLRRVIRRASRHARLLGLEEPVLHKIVGSVVDTMGHMYPEIVDEKDRTEKILRIEEERFIKTLQQGLNKLDSLIAETKKRNSDTLSGEEIFRLYDTYGFPLDLSRDAATDSGLKIDEAAFDKAMGMQKEKARASWVAEEAVSSGVYRDILERHGKTSFSGYETMEGKAEVLSIVKEGKEVDELNAGEEAELFIDPTPFYGESGGQVGDTGKILGDNVSIKVKDTKKPVGDLISHVVKVKDGTVKKGDTVMASVDEEKRRSIMRNHTATHLLHTSLRTVLGEHVKQSGSLVSDEKLRFDFTHFHGLDGEEIEDIENMINNAVLDNRTVITELKTIDEAIADGAMALFDEKYGEKVRVVSVENFSKELCGGTHCRSTGEIGPFVITSEGSVASGIRRIEAITGKAAIDHLRTRNGELKGIKEMLRTERPAEKIEHLMDDIKALRKEIETLRTSVSGSGGKDITEGVKEVNGTRVLTLRQDGLSTNELRTLSDNIRSKLGSGIVLVASVKDDNASFICSVTKDLLDRFHAGNILKEIVSSCGGRGGGKPHMAQGGTKETDKLDKALNIVYDIIKGTDN
ncbi:MAG: alanine--tRNA ligase [Nitrospirota bacterium]|nr:MAG: alanine--tRNA ligase [Nitrospirota bacterium]